MADDPRAASVVLVPGKPVAVRTRFDGTWAEGFRVCRERGGRYLVERCSDGSELPADFDGAELRPTPTSVRPEQDDRSPPSM
jgi:hypothetical protein